MKVLHICVGGPYTDGWNYQENMLTKYHVKLGHDVALIASQNAWGDDGKVIICEQTDYINEDGVKVYRLPIKGGKDVFYRYKRFVNFYSTIDKFKPDIIFVHNIQFFDVDQIVKYAKNNNVKIYVDNHADFSNSARNVISRLFYKLVWAYYAQKINPYVTKFYGVLPARVDFLTDIYGLPKSKCELLVMGADDDKVEEAKNPEIRSEIRKKYNISDDDFLIMTGGKIDPWKTQTLLLMDAVKKIANPKVKLIVFGSITSDLKDEVNKRVDGNKVQYIGWIKSEESYKYFAASDLVVFPGRHSVFWEQVTGQGIPMIVKEWPGTKHVDIGGNVEFLEGDAISEIYEKIKKLVDDPEKYNRMKFIAQTDGMKTFSYNEIAKLAIELKD